MAQEETVILKSFIPPKKVKKVLTIATPLLAVLLIGGLLASIPLWLVFVFTGALLVDLVTIFSLLHSASDKKATQIQTSSGTPTQLLFPKGWYPLERVTAFTLVKTGKRKAIYCFTPDGNTLADSTKIELLNYGGELIRSEKELALVAELVTHSAALPDHKAPVEGHPNLTEVGIKQTLELLDSVFK